LISTLLLYVNSLLESPKVVLAQASSQLHPLYDSIGLQEDHDGVGFGRLQGRGHITPLSMHVRLVALGDSEEKFAVFVKVFEFPWSSQQKCSKEVSSVLSFIEFTRPVIGMFYSYP